MECISLFNTEEPPGDGIKQLSRAAGNVNWKMSRVGWERSRNRVGMVLLAEAAVKGGAWGRLDPISTMAHPTGSDTNPQGHTGRAELCCHPATPHSQLSPCPASAWEHFQRKSGRREHVPNTELCFPEAHGCCLSVYFDYSQLGIQLTGTLLGPGAGDKGVMLL